MKNLSEHVLEARDDVAASRASDCSTDLAERIVDSLLYTPVGAGTRLQIMQEQSDGSERDLGGYIRDSAIRNVRRCLDGRCAPLGDKLADSLRLANEYKCGRCKDRGWIVVADNSDQGMQVTCPECYNS